MEGPRIAAGPFSFSGLDTRRRGKDSLVFLIPRQERRRELGRGTFVPAAFAAAFALPTRAAVTVAAAARSAITIATAAAFTARAAIAAFTARATVTVAATASAIAAVAPRPTVAAFARLARGTGV